jgi:hypothetical protein
METIGFTLFVHQALSRSFSFYCQKVAKVSERMLTQKTPGPYSEPIGQKLVLLSIHETFNQLKATGLCSYNMMLDKRVFLRSLSVLNRNVYGGVYPAEREYLSEMLKSSNAYRLKAAGQVFFNITFFFISILTCSAHRDGKRLQVRFSKEKMIFPMFGCL